MASGLPSIYKQKIYIMKKEGLCDTCADQDECMYNNGQPVLHCEEYSGSRSFEGYQNIQQELSCINDAAKELKGLCSDCEFRFDCSIRDPKLVIWRCEEYR